MPLVAEPMTLKIRQGCEGGGKGALIQKDKSATLGTHNDQTLFQPKGVHGFDRYNGKVTGNVTHTLDTGAGDTVPMVFQEAPKSYGIAKEAFSSGEKADFNFAVNEEVSPTLQARGPGAVAKPEVKAFGVCSKSSKGMLSDNPKAGFYEAETSRTLDQGGGNPTCNQGGICIVSPDPTYSLQGSMIGRKDKNGPQGDGVNEDISFTLNTSDRHAVAAPTGDHYSASKGSFFTSATKEQAGTLVASDWKDPPLVNDTPNDEPVYIVRRLTPVECARLQGFPDWWCSDLAISDPTEEEVSFWMDVWETWHRINGKKPKTENQVRRWLSDPYTDSAEYKLWGNGCALPCVFFVLAGIAWAADKGDETNE